MPSQVTISSGLTLKVPSAGSSGWAQQFLDDFARPISGHDHTGGGKGLQIGSGGIAAAAITTAKLADGAVTTAKLGAAVDTANIVNLAVTTGKIALKAVTSAQIADATIGTPQLQPGCVDATIIAAGGVTTPTIADGAVTRAKLGNSIRNLSSGVIVGPAGGPSTLMSINIPANSLGTTGGFRFTFVGEFLNTSGNDPLFMDFKVAFGSSTLYQGTMGGSGHFAGGRLGYVVDGILQNLNSASVQRAFTKISKQLLLANPPSDGQTLNVSGGLLDNGAEDTSSDRALSLVVSGVPNCTIVAYFGVAEIF